MPKTFERRMAVAGLEVRESADVATLTGYASTFNQPYDMGWYTESVDPAAFRRTLAQNPDVRLLVNHAGLPLGRTTSGTLRLGTDDKGLTVSADLDLSDPDVASLVPKMKRGDLNQMSFAFRTIEDIWENDMSKRTMLALDLDDGDVSVVTYPANPGASAAIRSDGPAIDAITSAMRALETRAAPTEDIVSVLTRALAYFQVIDLIVDEAQEDLSEALNIPNPDDEADDMPAGPMMSGANAATLAHELRGRLLALCG
jgi:HK97 family phage prohead protease